MIKDVPDSRPVGWVTRSLAAALVVLDVARQFPHSHLEFTGIDRPLLLLVGLVAVLCLNVGHVATLGFRLAPVQGWSHWFRMGLWFGLCIGVLVIFCGAVYWLCGWAIPIIRTPPSLDVMIFFCVRAPVEEELVYRSLLILAIAPMCGTMGTILISGAIFGSIHILGGNPGPDNLVAGFMLAWAFLKSKTILVPIAMHSAGNVIALSAQVAAWYWIQ